MTTTSSSCTTRFDWEARLQFNWAFGNPKAQASIRHSHCLDVIRRPNSLTTWAFFVASRSCKYSNDLFPLSRSLYLRKWHFQDKLCFLARFGGRRRIETRRNKNLKRKNCVKLVRSRWQKKKSWNVEMITKSAELGKKVKERARERRKKETVQHST